MKKILSNDRVIVIAGKDKGKTGSVLKLLNNNLVLISGVNVKTKHKKPNTANNDFGGKITKELPIHISNIAIFNSSTEKKDKVKISVMDGKKQRVFASTKEPIPYVRI